MFSWFITDQNTGTDMTSLAALAPLGPHVTGVIRFASQGEGEDFRQIDEFEVLARVHDTPTSPEELPKLKPHPIAASLLPKKVEGSATEKLQSIAVTLMFDKPENNLQARYEAFDTNLNRLACVGDGTNCSRANVAEGVAEAHPCKGPDTCSFANESGLQCQLKVRLAVQIVGQPDPLSVFELQSGGIHTYRTLQAKLQMLKAILGGKLRHVPLSLTMYAKSSPAYEFKPFYVADLVLRDGLNLATAVEARKAGEEADSLAELAFAAMESEVEAMRAAATLFIGDDDAGIIPFLTRPTRASSSRLTRIELTPGAGTRSLEDVVAQARRTAGAGQAEEAATATVESGVAPVEKAMPKVNGMVLPDLGAASLVVPAVTCNATIHPAAERPPTPL